jgi:hypothetical protein
MISTTELTMELLLIGAAVGVTGIVWASRARFSRRLNAAVDAYAEREVSRESQQRRVAPRQQDQ